MLFPRDPQATTTSIELVREHDGFPVVLATGLLGGDASGLPLLPNGPGLPLLGEHAHGRLTRPHLRGQRSGGRDWSTRFACEAVDVVDGRLRIELVDKAAALGLVTEAESVPGGALRLRHVLTNTGPDPYYLEGLEVVLPVPDHLAEVLDFTGRHERERTPQRHQVTDGLWLREGRAGRPGLGAATMVVLGTPGFSTTYGEVLGVHVGWSGNTVLRVERDPATGTTIGGGELLLPGEVTLAPGESYASAVGLRRRRRRRARRARGVVARLPAQPRRPTRPTSRWCSTCWEAVYFDHDLDRLQAHRRPGGPDRRGAVRARRRLVPRAARRHGRARRLDGWTRPCGPRASRPLVDHVRGLGMQFGLWIEPEMVNPDSDLYREHPDWILVRRRPGAAAAPQPARARPVRDEVRAARLRPDHRGAGVVPDRLGEVGPQPRPARGGQRRRSRARPPCTARPTGFYALLDDLRAAHPAIDWESCASGGGRVDLGVLERVQRIWTSDMTDAVARQQIQRWTTQLVAPEYVGAHVSSPTSHTTGRTLGLDFRAATAMFGSFGIEWDLTEAGDDDLERLADWVARYQRFRPLLHSGRVVRPESPDPSVLLHGVVAADRSEALVAHVQLDESAHNRGVFVRVPGLDPTASYDVALGGSGRPRLDEHVLAAAARRPDGRHAGDRPGARQPRLLGAAPPAGDGHARAPDRR